MSASKSDRLGRNPFDRGTYSEASKATKKPGTKAKKKSSRRPQEPQPAWRLILNELDRRAPRAVRDLRICKRVAALAAFAADRLNAVARHLEA